MNRPHFTGTPMARAASCLMLLFVGCQPLEVAAPRTGGATIPVAINAGFRAQAVGTDVLQYKLTLRDWNVGPGTPGAVRATHLTPNGSTLQAFFTNVAPGTYKVFVEAFSEWNEAVSIAKGGGQFSDDYVTISDGAAPVFSDATSPLNVNVKLVDAGHLIPGDPDSAALTHSYSYTHVPSGVISEFIWVPYFGAYQLINPATCGTKMRFGTADNARPAGYWVGSVPEAGMRDVDWRYEAFGGFYAGRFEASRADATAVAEGVSTTLAVRRNVVPWANLDWSTAARACREYHPRASLMGSREWTALAVWSMINNITVYGNNNNCADADNAGITFADDPTDNAGSLVRSLTGGRVDTGSNNETSHTGLISGVYDLNGNVEEWMADVANDGAGNWEIDGITTTFARPPVSNKVASLAVDKLLGPLGLPGTANATPPPEFGQDKYFYNATAGYRYKRGGSMSLAFDSGLWAIRSADPTTVSTVTGFRPVLR